MTIDWDDAYANGKYIEDAASYPDRWAADAAAFRDVMQAESRLESDLTYGPAARNRVDLFMPQNPPAGLAVFVHGGYWQKFDKSLWSHLAAGALGHGWAVALPSYTLAPDAPVRTNGRIAPPEGPGLGITPDAEALGQPVQIFD